MKTKEEVLSNVHVEYVRSYGKERSMIYCHDEVIEAMEQYAILKVAENEGSRISSNAVLAVTSDSAKNKKESEVAVCENHGMMITRSLDGKEICAYCGGKI